ncbi:MAG: DUF1573 domain-containing protein [Tissierellia bacterium]|nr:DUF1573 domain-containing protein [Tissierellia bacterium]
MVKDKSCDEVLYDFQHQVENSLLRHKSILDIMTKMEEYNSRMNRAIAKSCTMCGCIEINAKKQQYDGETFEESLKTISSHVKGELCPVCKENLEREIGSYLFYLMAMCNSFGIEISDVLDREYLNTKTLGFFSMK